MYDLTIEGPDDWGRLSRRGLGTIVDPMVYRIGQVFLEGPRAAGERTEARWHAVERDVGGLASFFDLLVLHERLPAFNYTDTFDAGLNFHDRLGGLVNQGDQILFHVDVRYGAYMQAKSAAIEQLRRRMADGPFVPAAAQRDILSTLSAVEYDWEPGLLGMEAELRDADEVRLARFLVGLLTFAGYAQQSGAPHVLSPRRSRLVTSVGLRAARATPAAEADIYRELGRRLQDAGNGWRVRELPWTPSFLPWLLTRVDPARDGPDVLLRHALELRERKAVRRYRALRTAALGPDGPEAEAASAELAASADAVARSLRADRRELEFTRNLVVSVLPEAVGIVAGGLAGGAVAGPPGAMVGGLIGLAGKEALRPVHARLWGWVLDQLPFHSARKLLTRAVQAERAGAGQLRSTLRAVWETDRRDGH